MENNFFKSITKGHAFKDRLAKTALFFSSNNLILFRFQKTNITVIKLSFLFIIGFLFVTYYKQPIHFHFPEKAVTPTFWITNKSPQTFMLHRAILLPIVATFLSQSCCHIPSSPWEAVETGMCTEVTWCMRE